MHRHASQIHRQAAAQAAQAGQAAVTGPEDVTAPAGATGAAVGLDVTEAATRTGPGAGEATKDSANCERERDGDGDGYSIDSGSIFNYLSGDSSSNRDSGSNAVLDFEPSTVTWMLLMPVVLFYYMPLWLYMPLAMLAVFYFQVRVRE